MWWHKTCALYDIAAFHWTLKNCSRTVIQIKNVKNSGKIHQAPLNTPDIAAVWPHTQGTITFSPVFALCCICVVKRAAALQLLFPLPFNWSVLDKVLVSMQYSSPLLSLSVLIC